MSAKTEEKRVMEMFSKAIPVLLSVAALSLPVETTATSKTPSLAKSPAKKTIADRKLSSANSIRLEMKERLESSRCSAQASELIGNWNATENWIRSAGDMDGGKIFSSPTSRVGTWIQIAFYPNHSLEMRRISKQASIWVTWKAESCTPMMKPSLYPNSEASEHAQLRDSDLQKIVDDKTSALIYAWSPNMPLSVKGFPEAQLLAEKLKLTFVPIVSSDGDFEFAKETAKKHAIPTSALRLDSTLELSMRGMHLHYPATLVISGGQISGLFPGLWENLETYENFVKGNLK